MGNIQLTKFGKRFGWDCIFSHPFPILHIIFHMPVLSLIRWTAVRRFFMSLTTSHRATKNVIKTLKQELVPVLRLDTENCNLLTKANNILGTCISKVFLYKLHILEGSF